MTLSLGMLVQKINSYEKSRLAKMHMYTLKKPEVRSSTELGLYLINDKTPRAPIMAAMPMLYSDREVVMHRARALCDNEKQYTRRNANKFDIGLVE